MKSVVHLPHSLPGATHEAPAPGEHGEPRDPGTGHAHFAPLLGATEPAPPDRNRRQAPHADSAGTALTSHNIARHSPFVPLLLGGTALLGWLGFQTQQLFAERQTLAATHASQQVTVDNAGKLRASLDALAADTQRMAQAGNPNARLLVEELSKRGVTINPSAAPGAAALPGTLTPQARVSPRE